MKVNEISSLENKTLWYNDFLSTNKYFARFIWVYKLFSWKNTCMEIHKLCIFYENVNNYLV
jgi:hypothetical protein